jgi:hypothetical protein
MIRFIDIGKQYWLAAENEDENWDLFSFIDTVPDKYVTVSGNQFWECWEDFVEDYNSSDGWREIELERFRGLVDPKFFKPIKTEEHRYMESMQKPRENRMFFTRNDKIEIFEGIHIKGALPKKGE